MNLLNSDDFWQFACTFYEQCEHQQTLLALQNEQRKNVNLCLLLYYLDSLALKIDSKQLNILVASLSEFDQNVMQPLRTARAYLKANQTEIADYAAIRKELLSAELKLEKQQQQMLIDKINNMDLIEQKKPNNIALYVTWICVGRAFARQS